jgi:membrane associated rhomboid family serine protease
MLVTAAAGAFAHLVSHFGEMVPMIGASAAISGAMAGAMRFVFRTAGPFAARDGDSDGFRAPAMPLLATLRDVRFLVFVAVWIGLNALFGFGTLPMGMEQGQEVAWQAHIGGFFAGLVLFGAFDPVLPRSQPDAEAGAP